ncbi:GGDEF domain-containing protein [Denitratisoma oestradiolicum]|uniref:Diguanylate cyclase/phosphodiesterase (GGDEF & EAL domains) withPAS/PAC sensor n=1 Tax=Denitratisoma oestradiolicum TaxID=311182 RepID=A0A6S6XZS3_9PROT
MNTLGTACNTEKLKAVIDVLNNSPNGVMVTDASGTILYVNPTFTTVTGYTHDEIIGRTPNVLHSGLQESGFYESMWRVLNEQGAWQGEISNRRKNGEIVVELLSINAIRDESGQRTHYVGTFSDITHLKQYQHQLEYMAHFDALTQLPNRILLTDRIRQAIAWVQRQGTLIAICYLDLDSFKPINDTCGHHIGDLVLKEIAGRLQIAIREGDTVARVGGDEFVLLLNDLDSILEVHLILSRLLAHIAQPLDCLSGHCVSASIGVTLFPIDDSDPETLMHHADQAMYRAKGSEPTSYHIYDPSQDHKLQNFRQRLNLWNPNDC